MLYADRRSEATMRILFVAMAVISASVCLIGNTVHAQIGPQGSPAYQQGHADRQSWESWFAALIGEYRSGAEYWAAHRSTPHPRSCSAIPPSTGHEWTVGCLAARQRLATADARRKTEPEYRLGWNHFDGSATAADKSDHEDPTIHAETRHTEHPRLGPGFPCPSPRDPLAQLICSSPDLSRAHLAYVQAVQALRAQLDPRGQRSLSRERVAFDKMLRSQCNVGAPDSGKTASPEVIPCVLQHLLGQRNLLAGRLTGPAAEEAARPLDAHVKLQSDLGALGFLPSDSGHDGAYGPETRTAIVQWQQSRGRPPTGFLDNTDATILEQQVDSRQAHATGTATASSRVSVPPSTAQNPAERSKAPQAANPSTSSPHMAELQQELAKARRDESNADLALTGAQNKLERIKQAQRDAKADADEADEMVRQHLSGNEIMYKAEAGRRYTQTFALVQNAEREIRLAQDAAANARARVQALEHREQAFLAIGVQCLDPTAAEETHRCQKDFVEKKFGTDQDFRAALGPTIAQRYAVLQDDEERRANQDAEQRVEKQRQEDQQRAREEQEHREKQLQIALQAFPECHGTLHSFYDIMNTNPYQTDGVCYEMPSLSVTQWLSANQVVVVLVGVYGSSIPALIDMPSPPATRTLPPAWVIGEAAFQAETNTGGHTTFARLRVLRWLPD